MTITIIGSLKFEKNMKELANMLTVGGNLVFCAEDKFAGINDFIK